ncbi:hypothetical protein [uncultured Ruegeria sp.]|nr:hypothetical protein [uncultured Ruegeria sp.]
MTKGVRLGHSVMVREGLGLLRMFRCVSEFLSEFARMCDLKRLLALKA